MRLLLLTFLILLGGPQPAAAHESRPAYLEIRELGPGRYDALWKRPTKGDLVLPLAVVWPASCRAPASGREQVVPGAIVQRLLVDCGDAGLIGQTIRIDGLQKVSADVLVRIEFADGVTQTNLLRPATPALAVAGPRSTLAVAGEYFVLGVEHILAGFDHLLFVLGLTLIVGGGWRLVKTITAFTVAHSITLALATFGVVRVAQAPVEAVIALSIVFLARELVLTNEGRPGLTARTPWLVAFIFGLLHGLGFAGALREVGLPQTDIPMALLSFNVGVEVGQLAFVGAVLAVIGFGRRLVSAPPPWLAQVPAYAIGGMAAYWTMERLITA